MSTVRACLVLLCVTTLHLVPCLAQEGSSRDSINSIYDAIAATKGIGEVAISPDANRLAWISAADGFVQDLGRPTEVRRFAPELSSERDIAWSPDSQKLVFVAESAGSSQLYVADVGGSAARKLTSLNGYLANPKWSPNGKTLAALFIEGSPRVAGPLVPMTPDSGVVEEHVYEQRIITVDVATGSVSEVSPADMYVYEFDWSPDGKRFVAIATKGSGDNNWWVAQLYTVAATGGEMRSIFKPNVQIAVPRWSPDGKNIAFISGLMSDQGVVGGDVYIVPAGGGQARNLTSAMPASASWIAWTGNRVFFAENIDGDAGLATVDSKGQIQQIWQGEESISGANDVWGMSLSVAADGQHTALVRQSFQRAPEVWAGEIGKWAQVTHVNSDIKTFWGESKSVHWTSDRFNVQGWLLYPLNFDSKKSYPLIVQVHGGPASDCTNSWPGLAMGPFAANGYFVLCPNPRGSFGQGETFTQGNVKDFGGGDFRDILRGVDQVIEQAPIDRDRLAIKGHSYGGYMTMWAVTQTNRFKAAAAGAGLSNWLSYYGENDIDQWMIPYFGASVYDDPAVYAKSAPINFVKNVKTPTLIVVGDRDGEVPAPQSYEWYHALKTLGVPTQLVVYPNEGHAISQPEHRRDMTLRTLDWFEKWLPAKQSSSVSLK